MPTLIVQLIGIGLGCVLALAVVIILYIKQSLSASEVGVLMVAFGFFVASGFDWSSIKISAEGVEVLKADVGEAAGAMRVLAEQVQQTDDAIKVINEQVTRLTQQLSSTNAVAPLATQSIQQALRGVPTIDRARLKDTRDRMMSIESRLKKKVPVR